MHDDAGASPHEAMHALVCMEIWGGNQAVLNAVSAPGIDAWVYSKPYKGHAAGGDVHYVSMCAAGRISRFFVADVSGHGDEVAHASLRLRDLMRRHINTVDQSHFTRAIGAEFQSGGNDDGLFATAVLATYFAPTDHLVVCNAGHPRPLWYSAARREWRLLRHDDAGVSTLPSADEVGVSDLPLGLIDPTAYTQFAVPMAKGDVVVLYTDSLMEAMNPLGEQLGEAGLLELARSLDPARPELVSDGLLAGVDRHRAGRPADDDVTLIVLHHNASEPPRYSIAERASALLKMMGIVRV